MSIAIDTADGVTTLTLDRPEKRNAITTAMYTALADALDAADADDAVRVVVIRGAGASFTAGNDLADFLTDPPTGMDSPVMRFLTTLAAFPKPLVAAVRGAAVGVGTTMLLHCDLVYLADDVRLLLPFVDLGLVPEAASSLLLPQQLGYHAAAAALLLGEPISPAAALAAGLANGVLPADRVEPAARDAAARLAAKPPAALLESKRLLKSGTGDAVRTRIAEEADVFARMLHEPAARAAFAAFLGRG
ncbi:enoyl-CoA hydratase-related protein [Pseudolysinimonas sp.]|uniref:enoyl-CoA hydratase-related protein n=1 Tax=Pseudolysinimonas sp. TaxID=2680009 RepID=UPI003F7DB780